MPEKRRVRLQKSARRALEAALDAARRARGGAPEVVPVSDVTPPSTPAIERLAPRDPSRLIESALPTAAAAPVQNMPPRPRKGESRSGVRLPANLPLTSDDAALIEIIDRLAVVADGSGLAEVELSAGGTRVVVRSRSAVQGSHVVAAAAATPESLASAALVPLPTGSKPAAAPASAAAAPCREATW